MTEFRSEREGLLGTREERSGSGRFSFHETRATKDAPAQVIIEGYAATFQPYDVQGGPSSGGWVEELSKRAFDQTLSEQPDLHLLINHAGLPLARTRSGNLKLSIDGHGLRMWASLDPSDPDVQALLPKMRRGDLDEMSFAFRVNDQSWDSSYTNRMINSLSLEKGDVSIVTWGANPNTKAVIADAVDALSRLSSSELVEVRELCANRDQVKRAAAVLTAIAGSGKQVRKSDEPYGDVKYADPGYKSDGKKRYPLDTEAHVRAAWSYINMPKNQGGYTSTQVKAIKSRIVSRAKALGIEISDGKSESGLSHVEQVVRADGAVSLVAVMFDGSRVPLPVQRALTARVQDPSTEWAPGDVESEDPHEVPYEVGRVGAPGLGPVPSNIVGDSGKFSGEHPSFKSPSSATDPHDISVDKELLSMDNHDDPLEFGPYPGGAKITPAFGDFEGEGGGGDPHVTPYDLGGQVGGVPGDRPNLSTGGAGSGAVNIVVSGSGRGPGDKVPTAPVTDVPAVGTAPVDDGGGHAFDWSTGTLEPGDPEEELDAALRAFDAASDPHDQPTMGGGGGKFSPGGWEPTNIEGGAAHSDAGDGDEPEVVKLDLGMAEALDRTIIHAYKLSEASAEVRKVLAVARKQLFALAGAKPGKAAPMSDIQRKFAEIKEEVGDPGTGNVSDYLKFLRSSSTAPLGYGGLLDHDPTLHVVTPGERLSKDALEKRERARVAAEESDRASDRLIKARREAELNDAIRRHNIGKRG